MKLPIGEPVAIGRSRIDLSEEIVAAILQTLQAGWALACLRHEVHRASDEVSITECLRDGMREALRTGELPWRKTMAVLPGTESRSAPDRVIPDGRTDIPIFLTNVFEMLGEHDPHAIVECKRVSANDQHLAREYVVEGIDRFCSGKYSGLHSKGFMVGYVIAGKAQDVVKRVNNTLSQRARQLEKLLEMKDASPMHWRSAHRRARAATIALQHSMFEIGDRAS